MSREEWLKQRKTYIGGSDIGAIVGVNKYKSAVDVYLDKVSNEIKEENTNATYWGCALEDAVAKAYSEKTGFAIKEEAELLKHKEYPFIAANIDRVGGQRQSHTRMQDCRLYDGLKNGEKSGLVKFPKVICARLLGMRLLLRLKE